MPAGEILIGKVADELVIGHGKRMPEFTKAIPESSPRAIRYAITALVNEGRARREGQLVFGVEPAEPLPEMERETA